MVTARWYQYPAPAAFGQSSRATETVANVYKQIHSWARLELKEVYQFIRIVNYYLIIRGTSSKLINITSMASSSQSHIIISIYNEPRQVWYDEYEPQ
jgi:hypothetical protein